ncbi:MAG: hypothetical protein M0002_00725 [Rhodospirillales bacterium]|nr:hypothetical protein [Rhodospirillales bacterium]
MPRGEPDLPVPDGREPDGSRRTALLALVVIVVLVAGGLFLWGALSHMAAIQDCVASGRTNCAPIATPPSRP